MLRDEVVIRQTAEGQNRKILRKVRSVQRPLLRGARTTREENQVHLGEDTAFIRLVRTGQIMEFHDAGSHG